MRKTVTKLRWRLRRAAGEAAGRTAVGLVRAIQHMDVDRSAAWGGRLLRRIGPWLPEQRIALANLRAAFPEKSQSEIEAILAGAWDNLGRLGFEFAHLGQLWDFDEATGLGRRVEVPADVAERFKRLRDDGQPALIFAAHLANWELPALAASAHGLETAILYRRPNIAQIDRLVRELRTVNMGMLVPTTLDAPLKLAGLLKRGMHVGMLVDQHFSRGVEVQFFGRPAFANPLIARLARQVPCPIHGVRAIRLPNHRFRLDLTEAVPPAYDSNGEIDIAATMQAITSVVEGWIREYPEQWLWQHRRWR